MQKSIRRKRVFENRGRNLLLKTVLLGLGLFVVFSNRFAEAALVFCSRADNDLYRVMSDTAGKDFARFDNPADAINHASLGAGVLILADGYPDKQTEVNAALFESAKAKKLRIYIEYPSCLPDMKIALPRPTNLERVVATADVFGPELPKMRILAIHDCHFVELSVANPYLAAAKVAGFDTAVYGLKDTKALPILFEHPRGGILVSTTKLSQFVTARYTPQPALQAVWKFVFNWLSPGETPPKLEWTPTVRPAYARTAPLPPDAARRAIQSGIDWHTRARMLLSEKGAKYYEEIHQKGAVDATTTLGPIADTKLGVGDGRYGVLEGFSSRINFDGTQPVRWWLRTDSNGESAAAFALRSKLDGDRKSAEVAGNLLDWVYVKSGLFQNDPAKANYGLNYWSYDSRALYGDNDARIILGVIGAAAALETDRWDEALVKNILGNFRTTGRMGFRGKRLNDAQLLKRGWQSYWRGDTIVLAPHYESWIWATYLWLYDKTRYAPLLERTRHAIGTMMAAYPDRWNWANGLQQERGRMLLPLAWLIRVDDTPKHRAWLKQIADDMEKCQDSCGAIREELGILKNGTYRPPVSNANYGAKEASLIQTNGDPVADLLYTCNFTFVGLHEAYAATGDERYRRMADRLAEFLLRVQVRSEKHPEFDGGWFRAFDYRQWDYWGSNADHGWGAWSMEVGWTQGWIPTVLALRELEMNLWDLSKSSNAAKHFETIRRDMIGDEPVIPLP